MLYEYKNLHNPKTFKRKSLRVTNFSDASPEQTSLLSQIYAPDPRTKLPTTDIGVFMSKETNPVIKNYIQENLMTEQMTGVTIPDKIKDDKAIIEGMPNRGETLNQYNDRVQEMLDKEKERKEAEHYARKFAKKFGKKSDDGVEE